jgi:hypothetical protein
MPMRSFRRAPLANFVRPLHALLAGLYVHFSLTYSRATPSPPASRGMIRLARDNFHRATIPCHRDHHLSSKSARKASTLFCRCCYDIDGCCNNLELLHLSLPISLPVHVKLASAAGESTVILGIRCSSSARLFCAATSAQPSPPSLPSVHDGLRRASSSKRAPPSPIFPIFLRFSV